VVRLAIPPLRRRQGDIPMLADFFCRRYGREFGKEGLHCGPDAIEELLRHSWPGNVRELENVIQRALALSSGPLLTAADLLLAGGETHAGLLETAGGTLPVGTTMRDMERQLIQRTLDGTGGNRTKAARLLGISLRTLRNKLNEFGLQDRPARFAQSRAQI
jgi:DNA-binding NtrC family response regulator